MDKKLSEYLCYVLIFVLVLFAIHICLKNSTINKFLNSVENQTFDVRQSILAQNRADKVSKDIVILTIDDASYEFLHEKYGEWPIPRGVYGDLVTYIERQNPQAIAFDLMFVKSMKSSHEDDTKLVNSIISNYNVYTAFNFDDQPADIRKPAKLDDKFSVSVKNNSKVNFDDVTFENCRTILPQIMRDTKNVGSANVSRSDDGVLRKVPPLMVYQDKFYPHLSLMVSEKMAGMSNNEYKIDRFGNLIVGNKKIPLDKDGGAILNWYGSADRTFTLIPMYKVIKAMLAGDNTAFDFKNKVVYIGTTAVSLYDTKTVPVDKLYPGVEVHTTFLNNFINNDFIKKVSTPVNVAICIILAAIIGITVFKTTSVAVTLSATIAVTTGYMILAYLLMKYLNLWVAIALPLTIIGLVFAISYVVKYILKSRDFDYQYKLATTDGLTEMYNHRYFQEQMAMQIANAKRYNTKFSLIMSDIDHFKKFNDIFGHQSGDAVLKQVAAKFKKHIRSSDYACRYGGEEMTIILPNTDHNEAYKTAEKLCALIAEKPFKLANNKQSFVTVSLGVATFPEDGEDPATLIAAADKRLYFAKENGRNQVGI